MLKWFHDDNPRYIEWRIKNEGYQLPPEDVGELETWRTEHGL